MTFKSNTAVLLPARLETRFYPPAQLGAAWRLRVLVIPDEPWLDRHDPLPTAAELDSLEAFWRQAPTGLATDEGGSAWQILADRHGGARAAWLLKTFPPVIQADGTLVVPRPKDLRETPYFTRIHGFPAMLELWLGRGGLAPVRISQWPVAVDSLELGFPDPKAQEERWWSSWAAASKIGLGVEVDIGPAKPDNIDVLYIIGVGDTDAAELFTAHRAKGTLGLIEPSTPTNTVHGQPAADLGRNQETWREIALAPEKSDSASQRLSAALTLTPDTLGALPGAGGDHHRSGLAMMGALWSVLWGHSLKDIWNLGQDVQTAGQWASLHVIPEGPLPTLRINDLPYGVLPVSSLKHWQADPADNRPDFAALECNIAKSMVYARGQWALRARVGGTVVNADTAGLLDKLGRNPSSRDYLYRVFLSLDLMQILYQPVAPLENKESLARWWNGSAVALQAFHANPVRKYINVGNPQNLKLPLIAPEAVPLESRFGELFKVDLALLPSKALDQYAEATKLPSLLGQLCIRALIITAAEAYRSATGLAGPALEPLVNPKQYPQMLEWALALTDAHLTDDHSLAVILFRQTRDCIRQLLDESVEPLERILRATLDSAIYRLDPWITAFPWRRLQGQTDGFRPLGLYAWVEAPRPGTPGPTAAGLLHAPSQAQALTAAILRDKYLTDAEPKRWAMSLNSRAIRRASRIAEEVRLGAHIQEVTGREVERIVGSKSAVEALRLKFPIRAEHQGRRVCDGLAVLQSTPAALGLSPAQQTQLTELRQALDAYGDLLVVEAVHHVVAGRGDVASAAMDAAAGLTAPPTLDAVATQRSGRGINSSVVSILPVASEPPPVDVASSPGRLADPAVADHLIAVLGQPDSATWEWDILRADGTAQTVNLASLGFEPVDAIALAEDELNRLLLADVSDGLALNRAWQIQDAQGVLSVVRLSDFGLSGVELASLDEKERPERVKALLPVGSEIANPIIPSGRLAQAQARRIINLLGERPAAPADLIAGTDAPADTAVRDEMAGRYVRLAQTAQLLMDTLTGLAQNADSEAQTQALRLAARWGITPMQGEGETLGIVVQRAVDSLAARLAAAPAQASSSSLPALARAIAELAAPEGHLAILSRIRLSDLPMQWTKAALDEEWLTLNAAVRAPLARLEAYQLEAELTGTWPKLVAWTNRPDDPWQQNPPQTQGQSRLIVIYTSAQSLPETTIAAGLLDSWGEVIPDAEQATSAAFGFNAPASRAQQAILVAVAPIPGKLLDSDTLLSIVEETRELAQARMVTPDALHEFGVALPMAMLSLCLEPK
jgi:hypothetical protein